MSLFTAAFLAAFLCLAAGYPGGAPDSGPHRVCETFRPHHDNRATGNPYEAQNEDDFERDDSECPFEVTYSKKFTPGETITLTIRPKESGNYFRGYILTVEETELDNVGARGVFGSNSNVICGGDAVTQSNGTRKRFEHIQWTAPANSSKKVYTIWMTVVKSFSKYWMSCNPVFLPAADAAVAPSTSFELPQEDVEANNKTSIFRRPKDDDRESELADKDDKKNSIDEVSSSSQIISSEDPDSFGQDESGNSDEGSVDYSLNRSGSSLLSAEKEQKRQQYFEEGIENFDNDIQKLLIALNKTDVYKKYMSEALRSSAALPEAFALLVVMATAILRLA